MDTVEKVKAVAIVSENIGYKRNGLGCAAETPWPRPLQGFDGRRVVAVLVSRNNDTLILKFGEGIHKNDYRTNKP